ncbi:uncharacterized protein [Diadema antillarum]|uniref:uncharacterized protein n=1 Tax=Diadema antillarum TaxID=105358 RepID=UPI003A85A77C
MMMGDQLILEEDYDENYQPTEAEIHEYATAVIGIDPETEPELMWIAREGISAPLPADWKPCQDTSGGDIYYFNFTSGESTWDHPCDEFYRKMVQEQREKNKALGGGGGGGGGKKEGKKKKDKKSKEKQDGGKKNQGLASSLGPLKGESNLGSSLGSLKGTGHLSTLGSLQDPGPGSTLGSTTGKKETSFLKKGTLDAKPLSMTGTREENIQMMPDFSEDEPTPRLNLDLDLQDIGTLGYEESEASEPALKHLHASDDDSDDDDVNVDFGIDASLSKRLGLMDADSLLPATSPELPKSRFLKSSKKEDKGPTSKPAVTLDSSIDSMQGRPLELLDSNLGPSAGKLSSTVPVIGLSSAPAAVPKIDTAKLQREMEEEEAKMSAEMEAKLSARENMKEELHKELKDQEAELHKDQEQAVKVMRERLEKELEDAKLELLEDKEDNLRQLKEQVKKEEEKEEEKLDKEKEKSLSEMRKRVKEETEEEEALLMEGRSDAIRKLKEKIKKEQQSEEEKIRNDMETALKALRNEVKDLREKEEEKLEEEKKKALEKIKKEVTAFQEEKMADLKKEQEKDIESLRASLKSEQQGALDELKRTHEEELEKKKAEAIQKHKRDMDDILSDLRDAQDEERRREEEKLRLSRENQAAIRDMESGMENILQERKQAVKEEQQKELEKMKKEHEKKVRDMTRESKEAEQDERKSLEKKLEEEKERLVKIHKSALKVLKDEFEQKKEEFYSSHEEEEQALKDVSDALKERRKTLEKQAKEMEKEEEKLARRRKKVEEEKEKLRQDQEEVLELKAKSGDVSLMEGMEKERQELVEAIKRERRRLQDLEKEKDEMEGRVRSLHELSRQIPTSEETNLPNGYPDNHVTPRDSRRRRQRDVLDTPGVDVMELNELDPMTPSPTKNVRPMVHPRDLPRTPGQWDAPLPRETDEDEEDYHDLGSNKVRRGRSKSGAQRHAGYNRASYDIDRDKLIYERPPSRHTGRRAWPDAFPESDTSEFDETAARQQTYHNDLRLRLAEENGAIRRAKEFLKRQKRQLHQQQVALEDAKVEWRRDLRQSYDEEPDPVSGGTSMLYEDVRLGLEREALELDKAMVNFTTGRRLVREKEYKLKRLEESLNDKSTFGDSEIDPHPESTHTAGIFLDESSGSSDGRSSSASGEDLIKPDPKAHKLLSKRRERPGRGQSDDPAHVVKSLNNINAQLQNVLGVLQQRDVLPTATAPLQGPYSQSPPAPSHIQNGHAYQAPPQETTHRSHIPYSAPPHKYSNHPYPQAPPPQTYSVPNVRSAHYGDVRPHPAPYEYAAVSRQGNTPSRPWTGGGGAFDLVNPGYGAESAEQAMSRKWRRYFGDQRSRGSSVNPGFPVTGGQEQPSFGGYVSARDQLQAFRDSGSSSLGGVPMATNQGSSTQSKLMELNDWLKRHRMTGLINGADQDPTSSQSSRSANLSSGVHANFPSDRQKPSQTRLELDADNQIRIREVR